VRTDKRYGGRRPTALTSENDQGVKLALMALDVFTGGRVIMVVGCDADGAVWFMPSVNVPKDVLRDTLLIDWSAQVRQMEEWLA